MKQELAPESRSAKTCTGGVLLLLTVTWANNTLLTCLEGMEPLMGYTDLDCVTKQLLFWLDLVV